MGWDAIPLKGPLIFHDASSTIWVLSLFNGLRLGKDYGDLAYRMLCPIAVFRIAPWWQYQDLIHP